MTNQKTLKFIVELQNQDRVFKHIFYAEDLKELYEEIHKKFPKSKIISIVGGASE